MIVYCLWKNFDVLAKIKEELKLSFNSFEKFCKWSEHSFFIIFGIFCFILFLHFHFAKDSIRLAVCEEHGNKSKLRTKKPLLIHISGLKEFKFLVQKLSDISLRLFVLECIKERRKCHKTVFRNRALYIVQLK